MIRPKNTRRTAITLVEIVVISLIIAFMLCMMLPAIVGARENARKQSCQRRLSQLIFAIHNYESTTGFFPSGVINPDGPIVNEPRGMHHSWIVQLLPFLEDKATFAKIDLDVSVYDDFHAMVAQARIPTIACPSAPVSFSASNYAACHNDVEAPIDSDNNGVFFLNSSISKKDIVDGIAYTLFLGEKRMAPGTKDLGWLSGTRATLRNTGRPINQRDDAPTDGDKQYVGGFGSWHVGVTHLVMGDRRVTAAADAMDSKVYRQLGHRSDGSMMNSTQVDN